MLTEHGCIVIHDLREYLDLPYRQLCDVLREMCGIVEKMALEIGELPNFTADKSYGWDDSAKSFRKLTFGL